MSKKQKTTIQTIIVLVVIVDVGNWVIIAAEFKNAPVEKSNIQ